MAQADTGQRLLRIGLVAGLAVVGAVVFVQMAEAGKRSAGALSVSDAGMWGSMGTARASLDAVQLVKCQVNATDDGTFEGVLTATCIVSVPDNTVDGGVLTKTCFTGNKALIAAIQAAGDSRIVVGFDAMGACHTITVVNSSEYAPKLP